MKILSLDPSINDVGYAMLDSEGGDRWSAWKWGTFNLSGKNRMMRIMDLCERIQDLGDFDILITEMPMFYSSEKGQVAAHQNYTIDLAAISFYVAGWFLMDHRHHFAITASEWKGSVAKIITARQFFHYWPRVTSNEISEHAIDAVMLLRYWVLTYSKEATRVLHDTTPQCLLKLI